MFIESLTPGQLVDFAQLLALAAFFGGLVGALAVPVVSGSFDLLCSLSEKAIRGPGARVRDLRISRRMHLIAARTARRELRKLARA